MFKEFLVGRDDWIENTLGVKISEDDVPELFGGEFLAGTEHLHLGRIGADAALYVQAFPATLVIALHLEDGISSENPPAPGHEAARQV